MRVREWIAGAVLATAGMVAAAAALEAGVRMLHLVPDRFWEPDASRGVRLVPGRQGWWTQEEREFVVPVRISQQGLRDVEHARDKPPGIWRVLILGDSFVEAMHVPLEATLGRQLEAMLRGSSAAAVEVISAGVSGYGTASEVLFFEQEGRHYQPDLVVLAFYPGNDVKNNSPALEDTLKPVYGADGTLERVQGEPQREAARGMRGLLARSALYRYGRQLLLVRHPELAQWLVRAGLLRAAAIRPRAQRDGIPV